MTNSISSNGPQGADQYNALMAEEKAAAELAKIAGDKPTNALTPEQKALANQLATDLQTLTPDELSAVKKDDPALKDIVSLLNADGTLNLPITEENIGKAIIQNQKEGFNECAKAFGSIATDLAETQAQNTVSGMQNGLQGGLTLTTPGISSGPFNIPSSALLTSPLVGTTNGANTATPIPPATIAASTEALANVQAAIAGPPTPSLTDLSDLLQKEITLQATLDLENKYNQTAAAGGNTTDLAAALNYLLSPPTTPPTLPSSAALALISNAQYIASVETPNPLSASDPSAINDLAVALIGDGTLSTALSGTTNGSPTAITALNNRLDSVNAQINVSPQPTPQILTQLLNQKEALQTTLNLENQYATAVAAGGDTTALTEALNALLSPTSPPTVPSQAAQTLIFAARDAVGGTLSGSMGSSLIDCSYSTALGNGTNPPVDFPAASAAKLQNNLNIVTNSITDINAQLSTTTDPTQRAALEKKFQALTTQQLTLQTAISLQNSYIQAGTTITTTNQQISDLQQTMSGENPSSPEYAANQAKLQTLQASLATAISTQASYGQALDAILSQPSPKNVSLQTLGLIMSAFGASAMAALANVNTPDQGFALVGSIFAELMRLIREVAQKQISLEVNSMLNGLSAQLNQIQTQFSSIQSTYNGAIASATATNLQALQSIQDDTISAGCAAIGIATSFASGFTMCIGKGAGNNASYNIANTTSVLGTSLTGVTTGAAKAGVDSGFAAKILTQNQDAASASQNASSLSEVASSYSNLQQAIAQLTKTLESTISDLMQLLQTIAQTIAKSGSGH